VTRLKPIKPTQPTSAVKCLVCGKYMIAARMLPVRHLKTNAILGYIHKRCRDRFKEFPRVEIEIEIKEAK